MALGLAAETAADPTAGLITSAIALFAVLVSLVSVLATWVMQGRTLRVARQTTVTQLAAAAIAARAATLRSAIDKELILTYEIQRNFEQWHGELKVPLPSNHDKLILEEGQTFDQIRLHLDPDVPDENDILEAIKTLKKMKTSAEWNEGRDNVVAATVKALAAAERKILTA